MPRDPREFDEPHGLAIGPTDDLRYAQWNGDIWQTETVDNSIDVVSLSLTLDSKDDPHIGYSSAQQYDGNVNYAVNENDTWTLERLPSETGNTGLSLALDRTGRPAIVYEGTENNGDLNYATKDSGGRGQGRGERPGR